MNIRKVASLGLAVALQVLPITRVFVASTTASGSSFAIISTWIAGALALMGGVDAVSGASSISVSPATATTGVRYSGAVQYSGAHAGSAKSWELKNNWTGAKSGCNSVYEIAPGLWLTNSSTYLVSVGGIPTASGTFNFTLKITDATGCAGGNSDARSATITISAGAVLAPSITTQPISQTVTAGANVSFTVGASGTTPLSYQWRLNGSNLGGATSATLSLTGVTTNQAGSYSCVVTNVAGSATSSGATLTVNPAPTAPSITTQPMSQTLTAGANVSLTVAASGTAPLSYQWRLNGANLGGATSATLSLTGVTTGQAGSYTCVVTNVAGSATSSAATLTVNSPPTITTQPTSQTVTAGVNVSFTVGASGTAPLSYQWRLNGADIGGETSATLSLLGVIAGQAGTYNCVVTNVAGSATSTAATLTVNVPPTITTQPASQTVTAGVNVSFTVAASGATPLSYQWRLNGANLGSATSATLILRGVTAGQAGNYTCVVTNVAGSATSSAGTLTVNSPPTITSQPVNQSVTTGADASFTVAASGTAPLSYQWQLNGADISGATNATLSLTAVTVGQVGSYSCVVTNVAGSAASTAATLIVSAGTVAPSITTQPISQTVTAGANASFTVGASGTTPLSYQWRLNGSNLGGATSATFSLTGVTTNQAGSYSCVVTNVAGSATSSGATLTVNIPPTITTQPSSQTVSAGANVSFNVAASGDAPLSYQWRINGVNLGGATSATLNLTAVTASQAGNYSCVVTNPVGSTTSSAATLTVNVPPTITTQPASQTVTAGANVSFTVAASGTAPLSYQWRLNGVNLGGAASATLNLTSVGTNQSGSYSCVVTNVAGSATSSVATLTVNAAPVAPSITTQPVSQTVVAGGSVSFTVAASGASPMSYQWRLNGANLGGATGATLNLTSVTVGQAGSYTCVATNVAGSATSTAASLTVNVPPTITTQPVSQTVSPGANVSFAVAVSGSAPFSYQWRLNGANLASATSATLNLTSVGTNQSGSYSCLVTNLAGSTTSSSATLSVQTALNPYPAVAGNYNGLFFESDEVRVRSAGSFSLHVDEAGNYSGWLQVGYTRHSLSGKLDANLRATNVIARYKVAPLTIELRIGQNTEADEVFGRVTDRVWSAPLSGGRPVANPPSGGDYTVIIPGTVGDASLPAGDGYATMHVGADGLATMSGILADGTRFAQSAYVTAQSDWPLYVSLYSAKGVVASWLHFDDLAGSDVSGTLVWVKQTGASATSYPVGFTNETTAVGSLYLPPAADAKVLNLSSAGLSFSGGDLGANFNNVLSVNAGSSVVNLSPNPLTFTFAPTLGSFTGQVTEPETGVVHAFGGVVLQKQNAGAGFMSGVKTSSRVVLTAP